MTPETLPPRVAEALTALRAALGNPGTFEVCYHIDADPGDGNGWVVGACDAFFHGDGSLVGAVEAALKRGSP